MSVSTSGELGPPSFDDFDVLKEAFLLVAQEPDAITESRDGGLTLFAKLDRLHGDMDSLAPPLTICLSGLLIIYRGGHRFGIRYRELAHNTTTENSSLIHDYVFATTNEKLIEFGQSIRAFPKLPEPQQELMGDEWMAQADAGRRILRAQTGSQLEPTAGDCGVLFDRMLEFIG